MGEKTKSDAGAIGAALAPVADPLVAYTSSFSASAATSTAAAAAELKAELAHFHSIPCCAALLNSTPNLVAEIAHGRRHKNLLDGSNSVAFFSQTLNTPDTIAAFICFYSSPPPPQPSQSLSSSSAEGQPPPPPPPPQLITNLTSLLTLGPAVSGFPSICHGGVVASILDECIGLLAPVNRGVGAIPRDVPLVTAYLNTRFVRPVPAPGTVVVRSRIVRVEGGKKYYCEGRIEDEGGRELARGEALFVALVGGGLGMDVKL